VGAPNDFLDSTYIPKVITTTPGEGETGKTTVYVRKHNARIDGPVRDQHDEYVAMSTRCAHLGCPVQYIEASQRFICPCHGGVYDFRGARVGGPPPRPLDRFYTRVVNGRVQVGPRFSVNSELRRFSPRDPGEPIDGIGQYLYPRRFSTPGPPK
jgi:Rieske Fe-S protein